MRTNNFWRRVAMALAALTVLAATSGCVSAGHFVDGHLKDVDAAGFKKTDPIHPVQLLFEFQSKGVDNERATVATKARVAEQIVSSGIFDQVSDTPVAGGALLTITVNNVALTDNAFAKGFATGLTFGLAGSAVSDGYIATASYTPPGSTTPITKEVRHAIHTTIGNHAPPKDAVPTPTMDAAMTLMLHQEIGHLLDDISHDAAFH
jgi:hypothetical protein